MPNNKPVWKDYRFSYTNEDDGVHLKHKTCDKEICLPEYWLNASTARRAIKEHAKQCGQEKEVKAE